MESLYAIFFRWIGHRGPVFWPPRSPDLTPTFFFFVIESHGVPSENTK